ncbi:spliceosome-associated protein CWC27 homolog [Anthonomus grandis grandis]|uniref:spliceosome-associated protein CWC27 homolog n=1 Tax=Anthonomus grandis grandis TaxID=2921223 RepID=UPI002166575D|nr:spliceosome-associated protein CWC27 homolog [Anthonomus grandis grandis]
MSNIYIQEPPTSAKILLKTSAGDIDVELWAKETPKASRNFIQLCLEGYYNNTIFHRVVKDFIVQGGDPRGDGTGGESVYGEPFKDEFHQRLRFSRRGLVAMANAGKDDNGSQFFFTLAATPELQNKHTIFGKVVGDTIFNMLKLAEGMVKDERPVYPYKIIKTEVLNNPFDDIEPRVKEVKEKKEKKKEKKPGVKNFKLLSFGEEAEEDEEVSTRESEKYAAKGKSSHDILNDPKLSSETEVKESQPEEEETIDPEKQLENIRKKLKTSHRPAKLNQKPSKSATVVDVDDDADLEEYYLHSDRDKERKKKMEELKKEIQTVKKEYQQNKLKNEEEQKERSKEDGEKNETFEAYKKEVDIYRSRKKSLPKKGAGREEFTLKMLESFKQKLHSAKEKEEEDEEEEKKAETSEKKDKDENVDKEESWLGHKLQFKDNLVLAKDANTKDDDWFEIYDPRNTLNKRRRGEPTKKDVKK